MKLVTRSLMALVAVVSISNIAQADMIFAKNSNPSIRMTIKDDGKASVKLMVPDGHEIALIEGTAQQNDSGVIISPEEGDVCPALEVKLFHDIKLGENQAAVVRAMVEKSGTAARQYCGKLDKMDGDYTRLNN